MFAAAVVKSVGVDANDTNIRLAFQQQLKRPEREDLKLRKM